MLLAFLLLSLTTGQTLPKSEFIFTSAPFAYCHASTIVELPNGDLMAAWWAGPAQPKPAEVAIWASRRSNGKWSEPIELVREPDIATLNPVLFYAKDKSLWLYYKFGPNESEWTAGRRSSKDDGKTWSAVEHLPAGLYGPIRAKPLVMKDGTIVSGTSVESYRSWACWIERSTDGGKTWSKFGPITVPKEFTHDPIPNSAPAYWDLIDGIIQPSVVSLGGNRLRLYARSTLGIGRICVADSFDAGVTWTQARPIDLPNPNSGIDAVALRDGRIVLIYNHTEKARTPLNLAVSKDGEHFTMFYTLEDQPGEYSYPAILQSRDGALLITYTWKKERIRYVRIPLSAIPE